MSNHYGDFLLKGNLTLGTGVLLISNTTVTMGSHGLNFFGNQTTLKGFGTTAGTSALLVQNSVNVDLFRILDNGFTGINTTPATLFHVNGISTFENTILVSGANSINFNSSGFTKIQANVGTLVTEITGEGGVLLKDSAGNSFLDSTKSGVNGDRITLLDGGLFDFKQAGSGDTTAYLNIGSNNVYVNLVSGNTGFGTSSPNASALLDMVSTTQGFAPPSMTGAEAEAIVSPKESLMIYATNAGSGDITGKGWWGYNGTNWIQLG